MAVTSTVKKISVNVKLENGTTETGKTKTVSVSLGSLKTTGFDNDKAMNIVMLLKPCLSKTYYSTEKTEVDTLASA